MDFKLKRHKPGLYQVLVNNFHRFTITKKEKLGSNIPWQWVIKDKSNRKNYVDFVSLSEAKDFIKNEILKDF